MEAARLSPYRPSSRGMSRFSAVESRLRAALESVHGTAMWNIPCRTPVACSFSFGVLRFKLRR